MSETIQEKRDETPACHRCGTSAMVRRKLHAIQPDINAHASPAVPLSGHVVVKAPQRWSEEQVFVHGFYCDSCSIGFWTEAVLQEVGLTAADMLERFSDSDDLGPDSLGR